MSSKLQKKSKSKKNEQQKGEHIVQPSITGNKNIVIYLLLNQYQYFTPINFSFQISNFNDLACQISQVATITTFGLGRENQGRIQDFF